MTTSIQRARIGSSYFDLCCWRHQSSLALEFWYADIFGVFSPFSPGDADLPRSAAYEWVIIERFCLDLFCTNLDTIKWTTRCTAWCCLIQDTNPSPKYLRIVTGAAWRSGSHGIKYQWVFTVTFYVVDQVDCVLI